MTIARRLAAALIGLLAAVLLVSCTPASAGGIYRQWQYPITVMTLRAAYPATLPTTYPGHDPSARLAADFMLPHAGRTAADVAGGWNLARRAVALARNPAWHIHYVVYRQTIWNVQRAREGWRHMADRRNWTQNHMDHVHVSMW